MHKNEMVKKFCLLGVIFVLSSCASQKRGERSKIIAQFDGIVFTVNDLRAELSLLSPKDVKALGTNAEIRKKFVTGLVDRWMFYAAAVKEGLDRDPEVRALVRAYETRLIQRKFMKKHAPETRITYADVKDYYFKVRDKRYKREGLVRVRRIIVQQPQIARKIEKELKVGRDFGELAALYNTDKLLRKKRGDLGYLAPGVLAPEVRKVVEKMEKPLEVAGPIRTRRGYVFVQYIDRIKTAYVPLEKVYDELLKELQSKKEMEGYSKVREDVERRVKSKVDWDFINSYLKNEANRVRLRVKNAR